MKTLQEILSQKPVFLNDFSEQEDVFMEFEGLYSFQKDAAEKANELHKGENVLFASYGNENYSGEAWVLFEKDGVLLETYGSHCSCYGLEDQWDAEEVDLNELEHRLTKGTFGTDSYSGNEFADELKKFLGIE